MNRPILEGGGGRGSDGCAGGTTVDCRDVTATGGRSLELCRLAGINFSSGDANGAHLDKALFVDCFMTWAHFECLQGEFLQFVNTGLRGARFYLANLASATFGDHNDYTGTDFRAANIAHATFTREPASKGRPKTDNRTLCPPQGKPGPCTFDS